MSLAKLIAGDLARPRLGFLVAVLIAWNAYAAYRLTLPLRSGHEAFIARQIGRTGRNHVVLGLGVTKGATVAMVRSDGSLDIHRSYAPLASWTAALPMAAGIDFDLSVRLPMLVSSNLFLIGLWSFVAARWGPHPADLALLFASLSPIFLFSYGLTCIFEILALGPLMIALALLARPDRGFWTCLTIAAMSVAAVMYSWICWVAIVPCLFRDLRDGHRQAALAIGSAVLVVPIAVHLLATGLASGDVMADLRYFIHHVAERSSSRIDPSEAEVTFSDIIRLDFKRWRRGIGSVPMAFTVACLAAVATRGRVPSSGWLLALFALGLPMNLARNIAYHHDFFMILFLPVAAICSGVGLWWVATRFDGDRRRAIAVVAVLAAYFACDVVPRYRTARALPADYRKAAIAAAIGEAVDEGDFVIVNPAVCGLHPDAVAMLGDLQRELSPRPFYCGQISQSVFVARDTADAERISHWAKPNQRVVLVQVGDPHFDPPPSFSVTLTPTREAPLLVGVRPPEVASSAGRGSSGDVRRR